MKKQAGPHKRRMSRKRANMSKGVSELPDGMVSEKTLRSLLASIATKLKKEKLSVKQTLAMLREQERLSKQLRGTAAARLESKLAGEE